LEAARKKWTLTPEAFDALLSSLGPDRDSAGGRYLEVRGKLVRLFEWRGCATPDDFADEAMNRCAKRIAQGEPVSDVASYSIGVARMMLKEMSQDRLRETPLDAGSEPRTMPVKLEDDSEVRAGCLRKCLDELPSGSRTLILSYYEGEQGQKIRNRKEI
jgi:DNA-directed RNA polymerase specialized sigma24 family protein